MGGEALWGWASRTLRDFIVLVLIVLAPIREKRPGRPFTTAHGPIASKGQWRCLKEL
jgi:hypothetical protein